jgi:hypothetical protein
VLELVAAVLDVPTVVESLARHGRPEGQQGQQGERGDG